MRKKKNKMTQNNAKVQNTFIFTKIINEHTQKSMIERRVMIKDKLIILKYKVCDILNSSPQAHNDKGHINFLCKTKLGSQIVITTPSFKQFNSQYHEDNIQALQCRKDVLLKIRQHGQHPNIIKLIEYGQANITFQNSQYLQCPFFIFEYAKLKNLQTYFKSLPQRKEDLKQNLVYVLNQLINGLIHVHQKQEYLHLDIRPKNILQFQNYVFKFTGFNHSQTIQTFKQKQKQKNYKVGINAFQVPEWKQNKISKQIDGEKIDVFSLGLCALFIFDKFELKNSGLQWSELLELRKLKGLSLKRSVQIFWLIFRRIKFQEKQRQLNSQIASINQDTLLNMQDMIINQRIPQLEQLLQQQQLQEQLRRISQQQLQRLQFKLIIIEQNQQKITQKRQSIRRELINVQEQIASLVQEQQKLRKRLQNQIQVQQSMLIQKTQDYLIDKSNSFKQNVIKQIIVGMIHPDPQTRLSLQKIKFILQNLKDFDQYDYIKNYGNIQNGDNQNKIYLNVKHHEENQNADLKDDNKEIDDQKDKLIKRRKLNEEIIP